MKPVKRITHRRGAILLYSVYLMMMMCAVISLAVDYGRIQSIKTEEQRSADATARGVLAYALNQNIDLVNNNSSSAISIAQKIYSQAQNPVDPFSNIAANYKVVVGSWYAPNGSNNATFHNDSGSHGPVAVQVIVSRTAATNNPVPLIFPLPSTTGLLTEKYDVWAQAIAVLPNVVTLSQTVKATYDPWLAGMPSGSTASYDDTAPAESPLAITVIPGSILTVVTAVTGSVSHGVNTGVDGPDGDTSQIYWHMKDPPTGAVASGQGMQNYIGDIITPIDSLTGVFLNGSQPSAANAPTTVRDYSTQTSRDNPDFNNLELQQPFYIGNGINSTDVTASFVVPSGATRFYMGIMDGYEWNNNSGSFSVSFHEQPPIEIVQ